MSLRNELVKGAVIAAAAMLACTSVSCGGGGTDIKPRTSSFRVVASANGSASITAPAGSVDPDSEVVLQLPATGIGVSGPDGDIAFIAEVGSLETVGIAYTLAGQHLLTEAFITQMSTHVNTALCATGAGPNDMLLAGGSLYIACSLDNEVIRVSAEGELLRSGSFPVASSPSYLAMSDDFTRLYVVRNGDNISGVVNATTLAELDPLQQRLSGLQAAFVGPGSSTCEGMTLYTPMAMITEFGSPTQYGDAYLQVTDYSSDAASAHILLSGVNGQAAAITPDGRHLLVTSAGSLQFDSEFHPYVTSDSFLDVFNINAGSAPQHVVAVNLGRIAASSIAIHPSGEFACIGNLLSGNLYIVNLQDPEEPVVTRGIANPIVLTSEFTYVSDLDFTPDGSLLLATSFNTDELYVVDPIHDNLQPSGYPAPFDLSASPEFLAGCQAVECTNDSAYVLYSIANAVARVELF